MSPIVDNPARHRFELEEDGHVAELVYAVRDGQLRLIHTGVPDELGGRGIGGTLVRAALDRARAESLIVVPKCPFAREWLEKHPDETNDVTIEW